VVVDDSTGKVFETSGNGVASGCNDTNGNGTGAPVFENDAVVRLSATLAHEDAFWPSDWYANWCINDQDLGSATPVILRPGLMFQSGKWGTGFLLNPNALGGGGGELFPTGGADTADVCGGNHSDATFASFAYAAPYVYVECNGGGISALSVNVGTPSFSLCDATCGPPSWSAGGGTTFGPPIVAGGMVFAASASGGLSAFDAATGAPTFQSAPFNVHHFVTLAEAGGAVFVPSLDVIRSFRLYTGINPVIPGGPVPPRPGPFQNPAAHPGSRNGVPGSNPNPPPVR
jgi:hypothetical protein